MFKIRTTPVLVSYQNKYRTPYFFIYWFFNYDEEEMFPVYHNSKIDFPINKMDRRADLIVWKMNEFGSFPETEWA